jgi:hypothetical protein
VGLKRMMLGYVAAPYLSHVLVGLGVANDGAPASLHMHGDWRHKRPVVHIGSLGHTPFIAELHGNVSRCRMAYG